VTLKPGDIVSLNEVGQSLAAGAALTSEDRIVTEDTAWERMTAGKMLLWLQESLEAGEITGETLLCADSDPEGNGMHPLRRAVYFGKIDEAPNAMHPEWVDEAKVPSEAVCFGVGY
jgi:hypothetical protein